MNILGQGIRYFEPKQDTETYFFASVTLTLTCWLWYTNMTWPFLRCTGISKLNCLGQGFSKLEHCRQMHATKTW